MRYLLHIVNEMPPAVGFAAAAAAAAAMDVAEAPTEPIPPATAELLFPLLPMRLSAWEPAAAAAAAAAAVDAMADAAEVVAVWWGW